MSKVTVDYETMAATVTPEVDIKYARKLIQDELKSKNLWGSTVWYDTTIEGVMMFHFTNPMYGLYKALEDQYGTTLVTEYRIICKECGDKAAMFTVDPPHNMNLILNCFMRQFNEVMLPAHKGHDFKIIDMRVHKDVQGVA